MYVFSTRLSQIRLPKTQFGNPSPRYEVNLTGAHALRPEQNGRQFADKMCRFIFYIGNCTLIQDSLEFVPKVSTVYQTFWLWKYLGFKQRQAIVWTIWMTRAKNSMHAFTLVSLIIHVRITPFVLLKTYAANRAVQVAGQASWVVQNVNDVNRRGKNHKQLCSRSLSTEVCIEWHV